MTDPEYESHKANEKAAEAFMEEAGHSRSGDLSRIMGHALESLASQSGGKARMRGGWGKGGKALYRAVCEVPLRDLKGYPDGMEAGKKALLDIVRGIAQDEGLGGEVADMAEVALDFHMAKGFPPSPEQLAQVIPPVGGIYERIVEKFERAKVPLLCGIDCAESGEPNPGMTLYVRSCFPGFAGKAYASGGSIPEDAGELARRVAEALSRAFPKADWRKAADFARGRLIARRKAM